MAYLVIGFRPRARDTVRSRLCAVSWHIRDFENHRLVASRQAREGASQRERTSSRILQHKTRTALRKLAALAPDCRAGKFLVAAMQDYVVEMAAIIEIMHVCD